MSTRSGIATTDRRRPARPPSQNHARRPLVFALHLDCSPRLTNLFAAFFSRKESPPPFEPAHTPWGEGERRGRQAGEEHTMEPSDETGFPGARSQRVLKHMLHLDDTAKQQTVHQLKEETVALRAERQSSNANDRDFPAARFLLQEDAERPLPEGWKKLYSRTKGREYYQHLQTGRSQWNVPEQIGDARPDSPQFSVASSPLPDQAGEGGAEMEDGPKATTSRGWRGVADSKDEGWKQRAMRAEALVASLVSCTAMLVLEKSVADD